MPDKPDCAKEIISAIKRNSSKLYWAGKGKINGIYLKKFGSFP